MGISHELATTAAMVVVLGGAAIGSALPLNKPDLVSIPDPEEEVAGEPLSWGDITYDGKSIRTQFDFGRDYATSFRYSDGWMSRVEMEWVGMVSPVLTGASDTINYIVNNDLPQKTWAIGTALRAGNQASLLAMALAPETTTDTDWDPPWLKEAREIKSEMALLPPASSVLTYPGLLKDGTDYDTTGVLGLPPLNARLLNTEDLRAGNGTIIGNGYRLLDDGHDLRREVEQSYSGSSFDDASSSPAIASNPAPSYDPPEPQLERDFDMPRASETFSMPEIGSEFSRPDPSYSLGVDTTF